MKSFRASTALLPLLLQFCFLDSVTSSRGSNRQSLDFILPDANDELGAKCLQYSLYYCLMGFWVNTTQSNRQADVADREEFQRLIEPVYNQLNWFSFRDQDFIRACCSYQVDTYIDYGQKFGLSPKQYFDKIFTERQSLAKDLVFIKAKWVPELCLNVINQIGYGTGRLRMIGNSKIRNHYMVPPGGETDPVFIIAGSHLTQTMTYRWFLDNYICREKPWLCSNIGNRQGQDDLSMEQETGHNSGEFVDTSEDKSGEASSSQG